MIVYSCIEYTFFRSVCYLYKHMQTAYRPFHRHEILVIEILYSNMHSLSAEVLHLKSCTAVDWVMVSASQKVWILLESVEKIPFLMVDCGYK